MLLNALSLEVGSNVYTFLYAHHDERHANTNCDNIYVMQKVHDILRQAWDVEGSPFKGQPFDPSVVNVSPSGI